MRFTGVVSYTLLLGALSLLTVSAPASFPSWMDHADKPVHFGMYAVYIVLLLWAVAHPPSRAKVFGLVAWACVYGFLLECAQGALPALQRDFSTADAIANAAGAVCGAKAWFWWQSRRTLPTGLTT